MQRQFYVFPVLLVLAACGNPLADFETIGDVKLSDTNAATAAALATDEEIAREGFFGRATPETPAVTADPVVAASQAPPEADAAPKGRLRGLFDRLRGGAKDQNASAQVASLDADVARDASAKATTRSEKRQNTRRKAERPRNGPDAMDVSFGTVLPYGQIARVCEARNQSMGRRVEKAPARGKGYMLFDSAPDSTGPRTWYITGFADDCPRQFTASLAMFGAPGMHEHLRYGQAATSAPYSDTDMAYEKVKSRVCRSGKGKACGKKIAQLEKNTVFVSTYERFGGNSRWADMLIHDGTLLAASLKTAN